MRIFQSTYRDRRTGATRKTRTWYIEFRDHNRDIRRVPGLRDRRQTDAIGQKIEKLVAAKLAGEAPDVAMTRWLENAPSKLRRLLASGEVNSRPHLAARKKKPQTGIGLLDSKRVAASKPLAEHLGDFKAALLAKGNTAKHA